MARVSLRSGGRANRDDFGMCGRIVRFTRTVVTFGDDRAILDDDRTDGHLTRVRRSFCEVERAAHRVGKGKLRHRFSR